MNANFNDEIEIKIKKIHLYYCPTDTLKGTYRFAIEDKKSQNVLFLYNGEVHSKKDVMAITPKIICQLGRDRLVRDSNLLEFVNFVFADHEITIPDLIPIKSVIDEHVNLESMSIADLLKVEAMMIHTQKLIQEQTKKQSSFLPSL